jgi:hypothetical protein
MIKNITIIGACRLLFMKYNRGSFFIVVMCKLNWHSKHRFVELKDGSVEKTAAVTFKCGNRFATSALTVSV